MTSAFPVFALLLWAAAAALLIWLPRIWHRSDVLETNEDWLRLRQRELAGETETVCWAGWGGTLPGCVGAGGAGWDWERIPC